jgi:hypothetical protein
VIVAERPTGTLAEIAAELERRVGIEAHPATIRKALRKARIARVRGTDGAERVERPGRLHRRPPSLGSRAGLPQLADRYGVGVGQGPVRTAERTGQTARGRAPSAGRCLR